MKNHLCAPNLVNTLFTQLNMGLPKVNWNPSFSVHNTGIPKCPPANRNSIP
jgi:hypothetical protein